MLNINYFVIFIGDAAAYRVFVYMPHPLQGSKSTPVDDLRIETCRSILSVLV
jgi:hypothetical protein